MSPGLLNGFKLLGELRKKPYNFMDQTEEQKINFRELEIGYAKEVLGFSDEEIEKMKEFKKQEEALDEAQKELMGE